MYRDVIFVFGFFGIGIFLVWLIVSGKFFAAFAVVFLVGLFLLSRNRSQRSKAKSQANTSSSEALDQSEKQSSPTEQTLSTPSSLSKPSASVPNPVLVASVNPESYTNAYLQSRPKPISGRRSSGTYRLDIGRGGRDGLIHIPQGYNVENPAPLVVWLHGAGMDAEKSLGITSLTDRFGCIVLFPESRNSAKWDFSLGLKFTGVSPLATSLNAPNKVSMYAFSESRQVLLCDFEPGKYGVDVAFIDQALAYTFERYAIDSNHLVLAGYSDGAAYALSVGLANGTLFSHVLAFAPVYSAPPSLQGKPNIFISHGHKDEVIPVQTSRDLIVPKLKNLGYVVHYHESNDPHLVTPESLTEAMMWFIG